MRNSLIHEAILRLRPLAQISVSNPYDAEAEIIVHDDTVLPSDEEILAECERMEAAGMISSDYTRNRGVSYPSLGDQFDMQYWDSINGTTIWKDSITAIKTKFPKPE